MFYFHRRFLTLVVTLLATWHLTLAQKPPECQGFLVRARSERSGHLGGVVTFSQNVSELEDLERWQIELTFTSPIQFTLVSNI